jgi:hypothetical protein
LLCLVSFMLTVTYAHTKAPYAECHYAECRYAECRGAAVGLEPLTMGWRGERSTTTLSTQATL